MARAAKDYGNDLRDGVGEGAVAKPKYEVKQKSSKRKKIPMETPFIACMLKSVRPVTNRWRDSKKTSIIIKLNQGRPKAKISEFPWQQNNKVKKIKCE